MHEYKEGAGERSDALSSLFSSSLRCYREKRSVNENDANNFVPVAQIDGLEAALDSLGQGDVFALNFIAGTIKYQDIPNPEELSSFNVVDAAISVLCSESNDELWISCLSILIYFSMYEIPEELNRIDWLAQVMMLIDAEGNRMVNKCALTLLNNLLIDENHGGDFAQTFCCQEIFQPMLSFCYGSGDNDELSSVFSFLYSLMNHVGCLDEFIDFIKVFIPKITGEKEIKMVSLQCLAFLFQNPKCIDEALKYNVYYKLRISVMENATNTSIPHSFVAINSLIDQTNDASEFVDEEFLNISKSFISNNDIEYIRPVISFFNIILEGNYEFLNQLKIPNYFIDHIKGTSATDKKLFTLFFAHLVHHVINVFPHPSYVSNAFETIIETLSVLSHDKIIQCLTLIISVFETDFDYYINIAIESGFEEVMNDLSEIENDEIQSQIQYISEMINQKY